MSGVISSPLTVPQGGTVSYIEAHTPALIPSERRVARILAAFPGEMALLSVTEVAERANTSPSTVIRACQSLGFKGFQHLRLLLLRDAASRSQEVPAATGPSVSWLPDYLRVTSAELQNAFGGLDYSRFDEAVTAIVGARRVLVVGNGGSGPSADIIALGLISAGRGCEAPADAVAQQLSAATLGRGDVCVALSSSGANQVTVQAAGAAGDSGAAVIGIAGFARSALSDVSTITLVAGAAPAHWGSLGGSLPQILLSHALLRAVVASLGGQLHDGVLDRVATILEPPGQGR